MNTVDANAVSAILHAASQIQQNYKMRREIDKFLGNPLRHTPEHVRDAFKESHGALTVAINDDLKKITQCKLWTDEVLPELAAELGELGPERIVNLLRTVHILFEKFGLVPPSAPPKNVKPLRTVDDSYVRLVLSCLSGNEYRTVEHVKGLLEDQEPLFEHSVTRIQGVLDGLVNTKRAKHKLLPAIVGGPVDAWMKARKQ